METKTDTCGIEPVRLASNLLYFYWGRDPDHANMDMRLGGGNHVIYCPDEKDAIVVDSMNLSPQGQWVRDYMSREFGITKFRLVNTHWHADHIGENHVYQDCAIIAHQTTRDKMIEHTEQLENGEHEEGVPPFPVVLPNVTFTGCLDLWCGNHKVELHEFTIHAPGHVAVYLPEQKTFLAADMLEDPIWIFHFDFCSPEAQIAEFHRMAAMDVDHFYPTHGNIEKIRNGGYTKAFIQHTIDYLKNMMIAAKEDSNFKTTKAPAFIKKGLDQGDLLWWPPYDEVHGFNVDTISSLAS